MLPRFFIIINTAATLADPGRKPGVPDCQERWFNEQTVDHFNWQTYQKTPGNSSYLDLQHWPQRYFTYTKYWKPRVLGNNNTAKTRPGPIFFYFGNEDNVELYVNNTGLMWENAEAEGALLIFAEHR